MECALSKMLTHPLNQSRSAKRRNRIPQNVKAAAAGLEALPHLSGIPRQQNELPVECLPAVKGYPAQPEPLTDAPLVDFPRTQIEIRQGTLRPEPDDRLTAPFNAVSVVHDSDSLLSLTARRGIVVKIEQGDLSVVPIPLHPVLDIGRTLGEQVESGLIQLSGQWVLTRLKRETETTGDRGHIVSAALLEINGAQNDEHKDGNDDVFRHVECRYGYRVT